MLTRNASSPRSIMALLEPLLLWVVVMAALWAMIHRTGVAAWERTTLGAPFLSQSLLFIGLPALYLLLARKPLADYGIRFHPLSRPLEIGMTALAVLGPLTGMAFPLLIALGGTPLDWTGSLVLTAAYAIALPITAYIVRGITPMGERGTPLWHIALFVALILVAALVALVTRGIAPRIGQVLYYLIVVGWSEEFLFRGVIQSKLNEWFGRPWSLFGIPFGAGLVGASLLFGLSHVLSPSNTGQWAWGLWTVAAGLVFGLLREKSGSFLASAIVHGVLLAIPVLFMGRLG